MNAKDEAGAELLLKGWPHLKEYKVEYLKMTAYLLGQSSLEAISNDQVMLLVYDDLETCEQMYLKETKQQVLEILNRKTELVKDYVAILRPEWFMIKETIQIQKNQGQKKIKLPELDLKLYEKAPKEKKESETVRLAKEYFGDKVKIKE